MVAVLACSQARGGRVARTIASPTTRVEAIRDSRISGRWKHFDIGWVEVFPWNAAIESGTVVAVLIRHLGFWSLNGARLLYTVGGNQGEDAFGYAYGTLTNHAESGEELFEVFINRDSGDVSYRIRAVSWPQSILARICQPIVRVLQEHFRRDSAAAMKRATSPILHWPSDS